MIGLHERRAPRRPDAHRQLLEAVLDAIPDAAIVTTGSEPWASVTFGGSRHVMLFMMASAVDAGDFADRANEMEFKLRGHIVADFCASVSPDGRLIVEALTVEDA